MIAITIYRLLYMSSSYSIAFYNSIPMIPWDIVASWNTRLHIDSFCSLVTFTKIYIMVFYNNSISSWHHNCCFNLNCYLQFSSNNNNTRWLMIVFLSEVEENVYFVERVIWTNNVKLYLRCFYSPILHSCCPIHQKTFVLLSTDSDGGGCWLMSR